MLVTCAPAAAACARLADVVIAIATGPEVLTGSTRLKAGSATKAVLNAITTAAMVRPGQGLREPDGRPAADQRQAARTARAASSSTAGGVAPRGGRRACWRAAGGEVKTAIVMARTGGTPADARARIARAGGHVRKALARKGPRRR